MLGDGCPGFPPIVSSKRSMLGSAAAGGGERPEDIPTTSDRGYPCCDSWGTFQCSWHSVRPPASAPDLAPGTAQTDSQATRPSCLTQKERMSVNCRSDLYIEEVDMA